MAHNAGRLTSRRVIDGPFLDETVDHERRPDRHTLRVTLWHPRLRAQATAAVSKARPSPTPRWASKDRHPEMGDTTLLVDEDATNDVPFHLGDGPR